MQIAYSRYNEALRALQIPKSKSDHGFGKSHSPPINSAYHSAFLYQDQLERNMEHRGTVNTIQDEEAVWGLQWFPVWRPLDLE